MQLETTGYTYEQIMLLLKEYKLLQRKAKQLVFEISNCSPVTTGEDMIDSMTFSKSFGGNLNGGQGNVGHAKDKTSYIAVSYMEKVYRFNMKYKKDLENELRDIQMELLRIENYIELLEEKPRDALRMLYIEGLTYVKVAQNMGVSVDTIKNYRKSGIKGIAEMYNGILR